MWKKRLKSAVKTIAQLAIFECLAIVLIRLLPGGWNDMIWFACGWLFATAMWIEDIAKGVRRNEGSE